MAAASLAAAMVASSSVTSSAGNSTINLTHFCWQQFLLYWSLI